MEDATRTAGRSLPFILIVAVLQGWALYGLHHALVDRHWPATQPAWQLAFYGVALFVPVTLQLLAGFARRRDLWTIVAVVGAAYFYFGWHHGSAVLVADGVDPFVNEDGLFALGIEACVLWLMLLPFLQARLLSGRWNADYPTLFASAWHNVLVLAEGALFTGLFWLLLALWAALFHMLGIDFFRDLFREPIFVYPVTALTFGIALHLIGSIDRLTSVVLEQILNVLKWLAIVAGVILTLFTLALVVKLPGLLASGERAIGAVWLLWLVAVMVLLLNAAYRDGTVARPYPRAIAQMLRWIVPLTVIVALTALYALTVRASHFGLTVERVWAFIVAGAATMYAVGYSMAVFDRTGWLARLSRVNVVVALALIATLACALTPILSPHRLAASSQFRRAQLPLESVSSSNGRLQRDGWQSTPFQYLRFQAGRYGLQRLHMLAEIEGGTEAARISKAARNALAQKNRGDAIAPIDPDAYVESVQLFPEGRSMDVGLQEVLKQAVQARGEGLAMIDSEVAGVFIDLDDDGADEFVVMNQYGGLTFAQRGTRWEKIGRFYGSYDEASWRALLRHLENGRFEAIAPPWKELQIGERRVRVVPES
ncbi:MAG TPA: DUF4153 domain-containing protein [Povalibacter sp.]|uniref:DUF4153 domain-containing protein n=1 Tax=Povalibacter sp. TaxID=1962978 RepID=UPI002BBEC4F8|nr:hypothetical protein [Povalibacter sp.]HMN43841.1 DUF4153 domain-containing protein [Povalibacter sp.]